MQHWFRVFKQPPQPPHGMERASLLKNYAWVIVFFYSSSNTLPNSVSLSPICKAENVSVKFGKKLVVDTDQWKKCFNYSACPELSKQSLHILTQSLNVSILPSASLDKGLVCVLVPCFWTNLPHVDYWSRYRGTSYPHCGLVGSRSRTCGWERTEGIMNTSLATWGCCGSLGIGCTWQL